MILHGAMNIQLLLFIHFHMIFEVLGVGWYNGFTGVPHCIIIIFKLIN